MAFFRKCHRVRYHVNILPLQLPGGFTFGSCFFVFSPIGMFVEHIKPSPRQTLNFPYTKKGHRPNDFNSLMRKSLRVRYSLSAYDSSSDSALISSASSASVI